MSSVLPTVGIFISVFMMCLFIGYAFLHREQRGIRYFGWVISLRIVYACCVLLELYSETLHMKFIFRNLGQTALLFMVPLVVLFVLDLYGKAEKLRAHWKFSFLSLFIVWALICWLNPHIIYEHITLIAGELITTKTVYSLIFHVICYITLASSALFVVRFLLYVRRDLLVPGMWMLLFGSLSIVMEFLKFVMTGWITWLLPLSVYVGFFGMAAVWFYYQYTKLSITRSFVMDSVQDGILIVNEKGTIMDSNGQMNAILSHDENVLGQNISDLLIRWPDWLKAHESFKKEQSELIVDIDGENRVFLVKVYPLFTRKNRLRGTASILFDITEKQRHLEKVRQLNRLNDQLFAAVSHDIRDPLVIQLNLMELLDSEKHTLHEKNRVIIDHLGEQIQATYSIVENLLEWMRIQKEGQVLHHERCTLSVIVDEVQQLLRAKIHTKQLEVTNEVSSELTVFADREAVKSILRNLLSNAIKYSNVGGSIVIRATSEDDEVIISVHDEGMGMNEQQLEHLFEPRHFVSARGTAGEKGLGLGLQICHEFVRLYGGRIWAESKPLQGSVFYFSLQGTKAEGVKQ